MAKTGWREDMMGRLKDHMKDEEDPKTLGEMGRMMDYMMPPQMETSNPMPVRIVRRSMSGKRKQK